jgi:hypothetical protein
MAFTGILCGYHYVRLRPLCSPWPEDSRPNETEKEKEKEKEEALFAIKRCKCVQGTER